MQARKAKSQKARQQIRLKTKHIIIFNYVLARNATLQMTLADLLTAYSDGIVAEETINHNKQVSFQDQMERVIGDIDGNKYLILGCSSIKMTQRKTGFSPFSSLSLCC